MLCSAAHSQGGVHSVSSLAVFRIHRHISSAVSLLSSLCCVSNTRILQRSSVQPYVLEMPYGSAPTTVMNYGHS
jgi:hypothetical protein